ncbi:hypothetical protein ABG067_004646 [Albugo candida]
MVTHFFSKGDVFMEAFSESLRQIAESGNILMQVVSWGQYITSQTHVSCSLVKKEQHDDCKLGMVEWNRLSDLQGHKDANMVTHFFSKGDVFMEAFSENLRQIADFGNILMQVVSLGSKTLPTKDAIELAE